MAQQQPAAGPQPSPSQPQAPMPKSGGGFPILIVVGIVIVILLVGLAYVVFAGGANNKVAAELAAKNNQTVVGVAKIAAQQVIASQQFNVSYTGSLNAKVNTSSLGNLQFTVPLALTFEKLGNSTRVGFNATGIPIIGSIKGVEIALSNGTAYSCTATSFSLLGHSNTSANASAMHCTAQPVAGVSTSYAQVQTAENSLSNNAIGNATVKVLGNASYKGQGCELVLIYGSINSTASSFNQQATGNYNVTTCLSDQYNIPLNLTMTASGMAQGSGYSATLQMNEVSIGNPVTLSGLSSLPAPLSNTTGFQGGFTTTIAPQNGTTTIFSSQSNGNYTCTPVSPQFNCTETSDPITNGPVYSFQNNQEIVLNGTFVSMWVSQNTGQTWDNVNITYVPNGTAVNSSRIPKVPFNSSDSFNVQSMPSQASSISALVINLPVSPSPGATFSGSLWARYFTSKQPGWQYTEIALLNGSAT